MEVSVVIVIDDVLNFIERESNTRTAVLEEKKCMVQSNSMRRQNAMLGVQWTMAGAGAGEHDHEEVLSQFPDWKRRLD
ncbi:hypothetical protein GUJ93_ZPchr0007g3976 [Zizania palustris]|uniref:Uncharacterized protein n=1 Tax=Zizania palustris TaxID=103762 RepID=A0A8J5STQ8_ZIZPA|nr:hypothetical protein GUJ93_ZPchr0007g3976 [Zizania palustris]